MTSRKSEYGSPFFAMNSGRKTEDEENKIKISKALGKFCMIFFKILNYFGLIVKKQQIQNFREKKRMNLNILLIGISPILGYFVNT